MALYLHIGMPKTGTTFLQINLAARRAELAAGGLVYPLTNHALNVKGSAAHHFIADALSGKPKSHVAGADYAALPEHVDLLKAEIGNRDALLSSEVFAALSKDGIRRLSELFPNAKVLVYLRRQDAWIDSLYGQYVKVGRVLSIDTYLAEEEQRLDYRAFLARWAAHFGEDNIIVRPYEGFQGIALWADLMNSIGKPDLASIDLQIGSANDSLPYEFAAIMNAMRIYGSPRGFRRRLERLSAHYPQHVGLKYLSPERAAALLAEHEPGSREVARRYLGRDHLFADLAPLPPAERADRDEAFIQAFGGLVLQLSEEQAELRREIAKLKRDAASRAAAVRGHGHDPSLLPRLVARLRRAYRATALMLGVPGSENSEPVRPRANAEK